MGKTNSEKTPENELRERIRCELARLDWIEILGQAIENRRTSWGEDVVREWRNASDQVFLAMNTAAMEAGIFEDYFRNGTKNTKKDQKRSKNGQKEQ